LRRFISRFGLCGTGEGVNSLETLKTAKLEPSLANATPEARYQFERLGYFRADPKDSKPGKPVFSRTISLRDSWVKEQQK